MAGALAVVALTTATVVGINASAAAVKGLGGTSSRGGPGGGPGGGGPGGGFGGFGAPPGMGGPGTGTGSGANGTVSTGTSGDGLGSLLPG